MDLWSVIPIGVHQYTILRTMVSLIPIEKYIPLGNTLENQITRYLMHARFSNHHSNLQFAYITQAWIFEFRTYVMQVNIWNAHSNAPYKFMSLLPYLCAQNCNWSLSFFISYLSFMFLPNDPFPFSYHISPLCSSPMITIFVHLISPPFDIFSYLCTLISPPLSSMTTKVQF